jgi:hypothetical protein
MQSMRNFASPYWQKRNAVRVVDKGIGPAALAGA